MHKGKQRLLSSLLLGLFAFTSLAPRTFADYLAGESFYDQRYESSFLNTIRYQPTIKDPSATGAFTYDYPIQVPPGRNGLEAQLSISYNSQLKNNDSIVGFGWSLNLPSITRLNKNGVDKMYEEQYFTSSLDGELVPVSLIDEVHGEYAAKVENGSFLIYEYDSSGYWTVTDKSGSIYTFGSSEDTRQDDSDDSSRVYAWMLEEVRDTNDNFISYSYSKDQGQIYPSQITYTGSGSTEGIFDVEFTLESRSDQWVQYDRGFEVRTYYRVAAITTEKNDQWLREYSLVYDEPADSERSLLSSITETGRAEDGTETSVPATEFTYTTPSKSWTDQSSSYSGAIEGGFFATGNGTYGWGYYGRLLDVNGDALPDFIYSILAGTEVSGGVRRNTTLMGTGADYEIDTSFEIPVPFMEQTTYYDQGTRFADINGDGLMDFLKKIGDSDDGVYINQGDGTWSLDSGYSFPVYLASTYSRTGETRDSGVRLFDVNGDGFADLVYGVEVQGNGSTTVTVSSYVYINNADGTGWTLDSDYELPVGFIDQDAAYGGADRAVRILDMNADGLADFIKSYSGESSTGLCVISEQCVQNGVYINQGNGTWELGTYSSSLTNVPLSFLEDWNGVPQDQGLRVLDVNADGLDDLVYSNSGSSYVYINTDGMGWQQDTAYTIPIDFVNSSEIIGDNGSRMDDLNGDGLVDLLASGYNNYDVYLTDGSPAGLLETINHSKGGSTEVEYQGSAEYAEDDDSPSNPDLPFSIQTVSQLTTSDGLGDSSSVSYDYQGGAYLYEDELNRQFAGFASVTKTEDGRVTETFYEQDDLPLLGRSYQTDIYDDGGNLYTRSIDTWATTDLGYENDYVYKTQSVSMTYDGVSSHRDTGTAYTYDSNGNVKTVINYGEVTAATDGSFTDITDVDEKFTVTYSYATDTSGGEIRNKVKDEKVTNSSGGTLKWTRTFYDSLSYGSVSTGNLTRDARWNDAASLWYSSYYTYNSYGLVATAKNPRGYNTNFTYDTYNLYPSVTTNPKTYTVTTEYDYATGQMTSRTDENGITSETSYDGLGRVSTVSVPDPSTGVLTTLSTSTYDDTSIPTSATTTSTVGGITSESVTYFDGFGRTVQTNTLAEGGVYTTVDTWYDALGNVSEQSLPYETSSSAYGRDASQYGVTSAYDALNRPLTVTSPTGTTTYGYSQWENTVTDANAVSKVYSYDAAGHLLSVEEQNEGTVYTSTYDYNPLGELITLTDAQGNERNFDYDSLGRKLSQEDLHDPSETSFGTWTYTYDKNNNLLTQTDPAGQVITWAYDVLDRVSYEDWDTSTATRNVIYTYDTATRGKMRLYQVRVGDGVSTAYDYYDRFNTYDYLGNPTKETYYFLKPGLTTFYSYIYQTTYDLLSRPTKIIYPSSAITVNYTYNETGALEKVTRGTSTLTDIVSDFDYSPMGQLESTTFANGVTSTNTYNPAESYRLTNKTTTGTYSDGSTSTSGNVQDLTYTYDSVGNITGIVDASITPTSKTLTYTYDDLNRLLTATSSGLSAGDYSETYTYDEVGNMTYKSDIGTMLYTGTGSGGTNPHAVTDVNGTAHTYDSNGNLLSDGTHSYTWDQRNRLSSSSSKTFYYNAGGSRYKTVDSSSGTDEYTYYMPMEELRDGTSTSAGTPTYYIFAGGQRVASLESSVYTYYHQDHLGGTALATDSTGTVVQLYDYYPYGSELLDSQPTGVDAPSEHSFTDKELDDDLGLYYFEARWYDSDIGRFSGQDPAQLDDRVFKFISDPQSLNFYAYSRNNPIMYIDPSGEWAFIPILLAAAGVAFTAWDVYDVSSQVSEGNYKGAAFTAALSVVNPLPNAVVKNPYVKSMVTQTITDAATKVDNLLDNVLSDFAQTRSQWSQGVVGDSQKSLYGHFKDHGAGVGANSVDEYYNKANDFIENGANVIEENTRLDGSIDMIYRNTDTGEKAIVSSDGAIRSYYNVNAND